MGIMRRKRCMYLQSTKSEYCDPNVPVNRVGDSLGQVTEMNPSCPSRHSNSIADQLASYVEVEPRGISRFECLKVSRKNGSHG